MSATAADSSACLALASSPSLALATAAVLRAIAARNSAVPDAEWTSFLEADLGNLAQHDSELAGILGNFGWSQGKFTNTPNLAELRTALPVFVQRCARAGAGDGRDEFERHVLRFINKVTPSNARQKTEEFLNSGIWSSGEERTWRLHGFAALMLRSFARVARYRPAKGNLYHDLSILSSQVTAVSELLLADHGLRAALDLWIFKMLGCQRFWTSRRLAICAVHRRLCLSGEGLGVLPDSAIRKVMDFLYPEPDHIQAEVARYFPPHAVSTEVAIVFGHLLWSCPIPLWKRWCPVATAVVEALLSTCNDAEIHDTERVHNAGIVLFAVCGRLRRNPQKDANHQAVLLGQQLASFDGELQGFVRHRVTCAIEAAATIESPEAAHS